MTKMLLDIPLWLLVPAIILFMYVNGICKELGRKTARKFLKREKSDSE